MNHFIRIFIAQGRLDLVASKALDPLKLQRAVVDQPSGELLSAGPQAGHQIASIETPPDFDDPRREQALSPLDDGPLRPIVHEDIALRSWVKGNPVLPAAQGFPLGKNQRADLLSL